jgi:hypothetical protein
MPHHALPGGARRRLLIAAPIALAAVLLAPAAATAAPDATLAPATAFNAGNRQADAGPGTARTYTVTSTGTDPLAVTGVTLTGSGADQFAVRARSASSWPRPTTRPAPRRANGSSGATPTTTRRGCTRRTSGLRR